MANPQHIEWLLEGVEAWNRRRKEDDFVPDFIGVSFYDEFEATGELDLEDRVSLVGIDLRDADLRDSDLQSCNLQNANLKDALLQNANLERVNLYEAGLKAADLRGSNLQFSNLMKSNLTDSDLRKANLSNAILVYAVFGAADLRETQLSQADLLRADLKGANLGKTNMEGTQLDLADVRSFLATSYLDKRSRIEIRTDLSDSYFLTQIQVNGMNGDSGTILPEHIDRPERWPNWRGHTSEEIEVVEEETDDQDEAVNEPPQTMEIPNPDQPFIFLSYSHENKEQVREIRHFLVGQGLTCWWDEDTNFGENWRNQVAKNLANAPVVFTLWSTDSVLSTSVRDEAWAGKNGNKLVHARLDKAELPFGFSEIRYADLSGLSLDDLDPDHPTVAKLLQSIKDKLSPPSSSDLRSRMTNASGQEFDLVDGKVASFNRPRNMPPLAPDQKDLVQRLETQLDFMIDFVTDFQLPLFQAPPPFGQQLERYQTALSKSLDIAKTGAEVNWHLLDSKVQIIRTDINHYDPDRIWQSNLLGRCDALLAGHEGLRPRIEHQPLPANDPDAPRPAPQPRPDALNDQTITQILRDIQDLLSTQEAEESLTPETREAVEHPANLLNAAKREPDMDEALDPKTKARKMSLMRKGLIAAGGVFSAIVAGVSINVLTAPTAVQTLLTRIEQILAYILTLF